MHYHGHRGNEKGRRLFSAYKLFDSISVIPHPRWVMQYRRKEKEKYIQVYLDVLEKVLKRS